MKRAIWCVYRRPSCPMCTVTVQSYSAWFLAITIIILLRCFFILRCILLFLLRVFILGIRTLIPWLPDLNHSPCVVILRSFFRLFNFIRSASSIAWSWISSLELHSWTWSLGRSVLPIPSPVDGSAFQSLRIGCSMCISVVYINYKVLWRKCVRSGD